MPRTWPRSSALAACLAACVVLALAPRGARAELKYGGLADAFGGPLMTPTAGELLKRKYWFEIPQNPVGVLFMAHGCVHDAADFWPPSAACPECSGALAGGGGGVLGAGRCWQAGGRQERPRAAAGAARWAASAGARRSPPALRPCPALQACQRRWRTRSRRWRAGMP